MNKLKSKVTKFKDTLTKPSEIMTKAVYFLLVMIKKIHLGVLPHLRFTQFSGSHLINVNADIQVFAHIN